MDTVHEQVITIITRIRESFPNSIKVYTEGSCVQFAMILKEIFKGGEVVWNEDHAAYKLNDHIYHITGEIEDDNFLPITEYDILQIDNLLKLRYSPPTQNNGN